MVQGPPVVLEGVPGGPSKIEFVLTKLTLVDLEHFEYKSKPNGTLLHSLLENVKELLF